MRAARSGEARLSPRKLSYESSFFAYVSLFLSSLRFVFVIKRTILSRAWQIKSANVRVLSVSAYVLWAEPPRRDGYPFGGAFVLANGPFTEREGALAVFICRISLRARSLPPINGNDMVTTKIIRSLRLAGLGLLAGGLSACYDTYNTYGSPRSGASSSILAR